MTYLYLVDGEWQQPSQQVRPGGVVSVATAMPVQVDGVAGDGTVRRQGRRPQDSHGTAVHWHYLRDTHSLWLWTHTHTHTHTFIHTHTHSYTHTHVKVKFVELHTPMSAFFTHTILHIQYYVELFLIHL